MRSLQSARNMPISSRNSTPMVETLERRQLLAAPPIAFTDTDGDQVTMRLSGPGTLDMNPDNRFVAVDQSTVRSSLNISVHRTSGGDGWVTLGELRFYGPMKSITGPNAEITHEISINDLQVPVSKSAKVSVNLGILNGLAVYTGGQRVGTFKLADWTTTGDGQELNAPTVDSIIITGRNDAPSTSPFQSLPGNSNEIMLLGDDSTTASDWSVKRIRVAGMLGDIQATGRIGAITAGQINGQIQATSITSISAKAVGDSSVATGTITGSITLLGLPGVSTSLGRLAASSDVLSLTLLANQGNIGRLTVGGDMINSTINSAGGIGSISLAHSFGASRIQSFESIGSIRLGVLGDSSIQVGVDPAFEGDATTPGDFANPSARLGSFTMARVPGLPPDEPQAVAQNTLSAAQLGTVTLRNTDPSALQIYVLTGPASVRHTDTLTPEINFSWHDHQPLPERLAAMLHQL